MTPDSPMLQTQPIRPRLAIYAFGALRLVRDGEPVTEEAWHTRQARQLLKVLLTERPRPVAADRLVELLWPNSTPAAAATTLRSAVNALRNVLEPNRPRRGHARYIVTMAPGYAFLPHPDIWLDVAAFEKELETARRTEDPSARVQRLQTAVALYQDDYLAGDPYADWAQGERERLRELYIAAQLELAAWRAAAGDLTTAMAACRQVVARDPVRETVYQALMRYQAAAGDSAGALLTYERCRAILAEELGADPSPLTQQIHQHILNGEIEALPSAGDRPFATPPSSAAAEPPPQRTLLPMSEEGPVEPLVGREQETATLRAALADALQGRGCVVVLEGEAGVGKTRLVYPPLRQAIAEAATVLGGACRPLEQPLPFAPLADLVGRYVAALPESTLAALPRASLAPLAQIAPSLQDRLPDLALPIAEGLLRGEESRLRIIEGLVSFLVWLAAARPLVLFLDDLHWADRDTLAVLGRLAQRCEDLALLLVLVYRTDDLAENDDLARLLHDLRRRPRTVPVPVRRLTPANVQELVRHYAAGAPQADELAAALYRVTEGNPLFVTEALRDVRERLAAYTAPPVGAGWGAVPTLYFNGRVHEVILERIERLPATAQGLLHLAAAFQRDFSLDLLEATADGDPIEPLQVLMQRRFLVDRADDRLDFSHAVVRQVAYERINALERRRLHARIAAALGRRADAEQSARELAFHLQQAGAGHQADFAKFSVIAGEQLLRGFGFRQAVDQFEAALAALERMAGAPPDLIRRAYQGLGLAYEGLIDPDGVAAAYRRLHAWAAAQGDRDLMLTTHSRVTSVMTLLGRQRESNDLLAELHVELSRHGDMDGGSSAIRDLVARRHLIYSPDDPEDTPDWVAYTPPPPAVPEPRADLLRLLDPAYAVLPLYDYGNTLLAQGQLREGTGCLVDAADLALATAQPSLAANAFHQLAMAARVVGDPAQSSRYAAQSQAATRQVPDASSDIANLWPEITGALLDIHQGRVDAAEARLRQVMAALAMRPAFQNYRNAAAIGLAAVGVARGHLAGTVEAVEAAVNDPGNQFPFTYVRGVLLLARVAAKQGRDDASAAYLRRCLRYAGQRSLLDEYVQAVLALMDLRPSGAPVAALTQSVLAYIRRMAITAAEQHVQTELDRYLARAGR